MLLIWPMMKKRNDGLDFYFVFSIYLFDIHFSFSFF
jgi:hypothetical protein